MRELTFTLVSDGSSDRALLPILTWLLRQHLDDVAINPQWADFRHLLEPPRTLDARLGAVWKMYPCQLLFIHRDAERETHEKRTSEILDAIAAVGGGASPAIGVIPVRMQEAWLLHDEQAIREAAGNRAGTMPLKLPPLRTVEQIPDPKQTLYNLLKEASGLSGRRLQNFRPQQRAYRIAEFIDEFSSLRQLSAFQVLEREIVNWIRAHFIDATA